MIKIYGIPNCDTVKKARNWLDKNGIDYQFIDFRKSPLNTAQLKCWADTIGIDNLLNKRSRTWRDLDKSVQESITASNTLKLMLEMPTLIKRPVLETKDKVLTGFNASTYENLL